MIKWHEITEAPPESKEYIVHNGYTDGIFLCHYSKNLEQWVLYDYDSDIDDVVDVSRNLDYWTELSGVEKIIRESLREWKHKL